MTYRNHPLTEAARYNDARAEEHGLHKAVTDSGLDIDTIMHVASQRAMRLVILTSRGADALKQMASSTKPQPVPMTSQESAMMESLTLAYLDGLMIGWVARDLDNKNGSE